MKPILAIVICTYNRADLLKECLESLKSANQNIDSEQYEVIVVDNNSTDNTKQVINNFCINEYNYKYLLEKNIGLSFARNTGYVNSNSLWIFYIDDDSLADCQLVKRAFYNMELDDFDCIGGTYKSWFKYPKPRWFKDVYGEKVIPISSRTQMPNHYYASGGIMMVRKKLLEEIKGFNTEIGMIGNKISYGEETALQKELINRGYKIGYDPQLLIYHLVAPYKYKISWHIKSSIAMGRDYWDINKAYPSLRRLFYKYPTKVLKGLFILSPAYLINCIYTSNSWQNWLIEIGKEMLKNSSIISSGIQRRFFRS